MKKSKAITLLLLFICKAIACQANDIETKKGTCDYALTACEGYVQQLRTENTLLKNNIDMLEDQLADAKPFLPSWTYVLLGAVLGSTIMRITK